MTRGILTGLLLAATVVPLASVASAASAATQEDRYGSPAAGVSIAKPKDWYLRSSNEVLALAKLLQPSNPEFERQWRAGMRAPLVVLAKHPANHQGFNPSFRLDIKPYGSVPSTASGAAIVDAMANLLKSNFKDVKVVVGPSDLVLDGQKAGYIKLDYVNVSTTGVRFPTTAEFWAVPRQDHYVVLGGSYGTGDAGVAAEMAAILKTVSFTAPAGDTVTP